MRSDNLQLPCVQPPTFSYKIQLPHGCHGHHGRHYLIALLNLSVFGFSFVVFHDKAKRTQQGDVLP